MLREFLDRILETRDQARTPYLIHVPGRPDVVWMTNPDGSREEIPIPWRDGITLGSVAAVVDYARSVPHDAGTPRVHVCRDGVAVLDRADNRGGAWLPLEFSSVFLRILQLGHFGEGKLASGMFDVDTARRFLRFELGDNSPGALEVAQKLARLDFSETGRAHQGASAGRSDLGKEVEYAASGAGEVPESFLVTLPIYRTNGAAHFTADVAFGCNLRPRESLVEIRPFPDATFRAVDQVVEDVVSYLRSQLGEGWDVLRGEERQAKPGAGPMRHPYAENRWETGEEAGTVTPSPVAAPRNPPLL